MSQGMLQIKQYPIYVVYSQKRRRLKSTVTLKIRICILMRLIHQNKSTFYFRILFLFMKTSVWKSSRSHFTFTVKWITEIKDFKNVLICYTCIDPSHNCTIRLHCVIDFAAIPHIRHTATVEKRSVRFNRKKH